MDNNFQELHSFCFNQKITKYTLTIYSNMIIIVPPGVSEPGQVFWLECRVMFSCCIQSKFSVDTSASRPSSYPWDDMFYWVCTQYSHKLIVYFCALCTLNKESLIISIIFGFFLTLAYHVHTCINAQGIKSNVCLNLYDLPILIETRIITSRWKTCKVLIVRQFNIFLLYTKLHSAERIFTLCEIFMRNILLLYSEQKMFLLSSKIFIKTYKWYCVKVVYPKWRTKCSI